MQNTISIVNQDWGVQGFGLQIGPAMQAQLFLGVHLASTATHCGLSLKIVP